MDHYRYEVELIADDGRVLGAVPAEPDWEPALECAAFSAVRRGRLPALSSAPAGQVEPLWDAARGRPFVAGFRLHVDGAEPADLPLAYLWPAARAAASRLIESGALQPGASFRYRVHALPAPAAPDSDGDLGFAIEEVPTALPVSEGLLADFLVRAVRAGPAPEADEFPVFIARSVLDEAVARARAHPDVEVGGLLAGRLWRDAALPEMFLEVTAQFPARHTVADATTLTFTAETWTAFEAAMASCDPSLLRCGWHHSHLNWCRHCPRESQRRCTRSNARLSEEDLHLHRVVFGHSAPGVALLISDNIHTGMTWSLYGWRHGALAERGFHIIDWP
jgi:hypothetical protein